MQSTKRESTPRQMSVDFLYAERQHCPPASARALDAPNALSKLLDNRGRAGARMSFATRRKTSLFLICSHCEVRVNAGSAGWLGSSGLRCCPRRLLLPSDSRRGQQSLMLAAMAATWASVWVRAFFAYGVSRSRSPSARPCPLARAFDFRPHLARGRAHAPREGKC